MHFLRVERVLDAFESKIIPINIEGIGFPNKVSDHSSLTLLTPKQMLQKSSITSVQVKAGNTSTNLLNEIRQIIYSLHQKKKKKLLKRYITI